MRTLLLAGIAFLAIAGGVARSQETAAPKQDMHAMMAGQQHMMMAMQESNRKLDDLIAQLNAAKGNDRIDKLVAVVNELAAERKQMAGMMSMHAGMMNMTTPPKAGDEHHK